VGVLVVVGVSLGVGVLLGVGETRGVGVGVGVAVAGGLQSPKLAVALVPAVTVTVISSGVVEIGQQGGFFSVTV
jgi:hypothetical protein